MNTTTDTYETDLAAAMKLGAAFVDPAQADGHGAKWLGDALNDAWAEGMTIEQWVARAVASIPAGFRRGSAE
jgi:hypothetical protein